MVWRPAGEEARLGGGEPVAGGDDAGGGDALSAKMVEDGAAAGIGSEHANGKDAGTEICEIVDGVGCAAWIGFCAAVAQDQHRGFARDARDFARGKFIEHEIADDADGLLRKGRDDIEEPGEIYSGVQRDAVCVLRRMLWCFCEPGSRDLHRD